MSYWLLSKAEAPLESLAGRQRSFLTQAPGRTMADQLPGEMGGTASYYALIGDKHGIRQHGDWAPVLDGAAARLGCDVIAVRLPNPSCVYVLHGLMALSCGKGVGTRKLFQPTLITRLLKLAGWGFILAETLAWSQVTCFAARLWVMAKRRFRGDIKNNLQSLYVVVLFEDTFDDPRRKLLIASAGYCILLRQPRLF